MKKEVLTLSNIRQVLSRFPRFYRYYSIEWRYIFFLLITPVAVLIGMVFKSLWAGLLVFTAATYHIFRFLVTFQFVSLSLNHPKTTRFDRALSFFACFLVLTMV